MPRKTYKKRTYKKRAYKTRRYRRRYYKRRYYKKSIKKPEIHISKNTIDIGPSSSVKNGDFVNITTIGGTNASNSDDIKYTLNNADIQGRKIRLKYLYIKGYLSTGSSLDNDINGKLYIIRRVKNVSNGGMTWSTLLDMPFALNSPSSWTLDNINDILYCYDWKNDINGQIKHYVKKIYAKYDNTNNLIPFKIRIPLYDCVMVCDSSYDTTSNQFAPSSYPSTNGIFVSYVTNNNTGQITTHQLRLKWKLYYTDY